MQAPSQPSGFTLFETLIAISVGATLFGLVLGIYVLTLRTLSDNQDRSELTGESRSVMERAARDIRETRRIATALPETPDEPGNPPPSELELEDGHAAVLQYIRYYQDGTDLKRQIRQYSFPAEPEVLVPFDAEDDFGNPATVSVVSDAVIGQFVESIGYYGLNPVSVLLTLRKGSITNVSRTSLYGRNR
ncbi:MAG: hypothetical protein HYS45_02845 [Parcubacteria group bacterium]|nr:hypothetical protein [Parcubacteria group bacterium]